MAEQIAEHQRVETLRNRLRAAELEGDEVTARRLRTDYERAKRRWHRLVREATARQRRRR